MHRAHTVQDRRQDERGSRAALGAAPARAAAAQRRPRLPVLQGATPIRSNPLVCPALGDTIVHVLQERAAAPASDVHPLDDWSPEGEEAATRAGRAARRPRWGLWLSLLALLVALRLALPVLLGPLAEKRLSRVLDADVEIGDLSFAPIDAVVTLHDVTVHPRHATQARDRASRRRDAAPAIAAQKVRIDLQWLPLLHRSLVVRELALEEAYIDPSRFAETGRGVERFLALDPASELPPGWTFAIERVALHETRLRLRELGGRDAPLDVGVREARIATRQRRASAFQHAPNLRIDALVDGGRVRVDGSSDLRPDGVAIDALVRLKDVPLDRLEAYLPELGATRASGRVSGQLHYQRQPERRDLLTGRVRLWRVALRVPTLDEPALAIRRVEAEVDAIDLRHRRVAIDALVLHGARLAVRADPGAVLPLLDGFGAADDAARAERAAVGEADETAKPWSWLVRRVDVPRAELHVAGADDEIVLRAVAAGENIGPDAYWSPLRAWVAGRRGVAELDGTARLTDGLTIDGRLTVRDVDAPTFARAFGVPHADLLQAGRGSAELDVEIEPGATDEPPYHVRGEIRVDAPWAAGPVAGELAVGARTVQLQLAVVPPKRERGRVRPVRIEVGKARVVDPYVLVTRAPEGWLLPPFPVEEAPGEGALAALDGVEARSDAAPAAQPSEPPRDAPPRAEVVMAHVEASGGRVLIVDRATEPELVLDLDVAEAWASNVRLPDLALGEFVVQAADRRFATLQVAGSSDGARRDVEIYAQSLPLAATAPYLERAGLPYRFVGGTGSLVARLALANGRWRADTTLTLDDPRLGGDTTTLQRALGMPVEQALAALQDRDGEVTLQLPLAAPRDSSGAAVGGMVASALREAVTRARRTPLPDAPIAIAFRPGRTDLGPAAARQIAALADLLDARPDVVLELRSDVSGEDRRWLAEQAAVAYLDEPGAIDGVLRAFGVKSEHDRIREALAARARGYPGRLDPDDEALLRELVAAVPPIPEYRLEALAAERLRLVAETLTRRHGISPGRVLVSYPGRDETGGPPAVRALVDLGEPAARRAPGRSAEWREGRPW